MAVRTRHGTRIDSPARRGATWLVVLGGLAIGAGAAANGAGVSLLAGCMRGGDRALDSTSGHCGHGAPFEPARSTSTC